MTVIQWFVTLYLFFGAFHAGIFVGVTGASVENSVGRWDAYTVPATMLAFFCWPIIPAVICIRGWR